MVGFDNTERLVAQRGFGINYLSVVNHVIAREIRAGIAAALELNLVNDSRCPRYRIYVVDPVV